MPCPAAHATCTMPVAGCGNRKVNWLGPSTVMLEAATLLINKSAASTPVTASLNSTVRLLKELTVVPASGVRMETMGGVRSTKV